MAQKLGVLYLIPTPLGETLLETIAPKYNLQLIDSIKYFIAENAKAARAFLKLAGISRPLQSLHISELNEHIPVTALKELIAPLLAGHDVGLVSDAGCPAVADPGANLVRFAHEHGIKVAPLVGPSSILLALMASGLNGQKFCFHGYLPANKTERITTLKQLEIESAKLKQTQLFIETPYRNNAMLEDILAACKHTTQLCVAYDLTTSSETIRTQSISQWRKAIPDLNKRPAIFLLLG
ncbi:MAG: SAM-dependent methyltransferase [Burkholderiales bacterium]